MQCASQMFAGVVYDALPYHSPAITPTTAAVRIP